MAVNFSQFVNTFNAKNNTVFDIKEVYRQNKLFNKYIQYNYHYKKPQNKTMNRQNFTYGKTSHWIV